MADRGKLVSLVGAVTSHLLRGLITGLGMGLFALSMLARVVHQPKLEKPDGQ